MVCTLNNSAAIQGDVLSCLLTSQEELQQRIVAIIMAITVSLEGRALFGDAVQYSFYLL